MRRMIEIARVVCCGVIVIGVCGLVTAPRAAAVNFANGDVFVAVGSGQVQWRHANGALETTLNTGLGGFTTGMAFDSAGKLYVTGFGVNQVSVFNTDGTLAGTFGAGYASPESIVFDQAGNVYVGNVGNTGIRKFNSAGGLLTTYPVGRVDWMDLGCDQCTMLWTTEGTFIKSVNVCTGVVQPDFVTSGSGLLAGGNAYALRIIPTGPFAGQVLLADALNIKRISANGLAVLATYDVAGENSWFALNLDPDGTSFWSADFSTANVYKFDIATGMTSTTFNTGTGGNTVFGLVVNGELTCGTFTSNLTLDPPNAINMVGQMHTVTACVNSNGVPIAGVPININVAGANGGIFSACMSDTNGCCSLTYTGFNLGNDNITAIAVVGGQTNTAFASKTWVGPSTINCEVQFFLTNGVQVVGNDCGNAGLVGVPAGTTVLVNVQACADPGNPGPISNLIYTVAIDGLVDTNACFSPGPVAPGDCDNTLQNCLIPFTCDTAGTHIIVATVTAQANCSDCVVAACTITIECCPTCPTCELDDSGNPVTVVVDQNVTVNFNTQPPTYSGDPELLPYFTYDTNGPTADTWKAIFNVGGKALLITSNATITTTPVPATSNNRRAPGIEIDSTCTLTVNSGSKILVQSENRQAGDILIHVDGNVTIDGTVSNVVTGTRGRPGKITIGTDCGDIVTGPQGRIVTYGQDFGGSDINLASCGDGDIVINGLVDASYKALSASIIRIAAFDGSVMIDGTTDLGQEVVAGTRRAISSGVSVRSRRDPLPGAILIQAERDIVVQGSRLLSKKYPNYGAVAVKTASNSSKGGLIDVRSLGAGIFGTDRAFDNANRFNAAAQINLLAEGDVNLAVSASIDDGATSNSKPVVTTQAGDTGKGGTNRIQAFNEFIAIGANAQVLADFAGRPGAVGANLLTSCLGVFKAGTVSPPDTDVLDDSGVCGGGPDPLFLDCSELGIQF